MTTPADTAPAAPPATFSWSRVAMVMRYYLPRLRWQLWVYPLVGTLLAVIMSLTLRYTNINLYAFLKIIPEAMVIFAPLAFYRAGGRPTDITLPALPSEQTLVMTGWTMLVVPVLIFFPFFLVSYLMGTAGEQIIAKVAGDAQLSPLGIDPATLLPHFYNKLCLYGLSVAINTWMPSLFCLLMVIILRRNTVSIAVAATIGLIIVYAFIIGIFSVGAVLIDFHGIRSALANSPGALPGPAFTDAIATLTRQSIIFGFILMGSVIIAILCLIPRRLRLRSI